MKLGYVAGLVQASLGAALVGCAATVPAPEPLRVPETQRLIAQLHATGVQIYECQPRKNDPALFEWSFKQPEATLSTKAGKAAGKHYAGPTWEANDGSKVIGEVVARSDSPKPDSIPWLLLRAKTTAGDGLFSGALSIQRLDTEGGSAPANGCLQAQSGQELRVPYTANYLFYGMKP
jgi:FtsP/CotA-like multicopper oxidase with cupredoxin domain